jgi:transcriptional regulator with XRE-family HTH domain
MTLNPMQLRLRAKKLGVLIADARISASKQIAECAKAIGVQPSDFEQYELGAKSPSLPELELLAFYLYIPLDHFLGNDPLLSADTSSYGIDNNQQLANRNRSIGASLKAKRTESELSLEGVADQIGLQADQLEAYELGDVPVPLPILETLTNIYGEPVSRYYDENGPFGSLDNQQQMVQEYLQLPPELRMFVAKPVNRPYLELALKLSDMSVEKLRAVAEVLLEITL